MRPDFNPPPFSGEKLIESDGPPRLTRGRVPAAVTLAEARNEKCRRHHASRDGPLSGRRYWDERSHLQQWLQTSNSGGLKDVECSLCKESKHRFLYMYEETESRPHPRGLYRPVVLSRATSNLAEQ